MKRAVGLAALVSFAALSATLAEGQKKEKEKKAVKEQPTPVVVLAAQAARAPSSSLTYRLLPDPLEGEEGNAAPVWVRASLAARAVDHKWTPKQYAWDHAGDGGTALKDLPRKEMRDILAKYSGALRLAEQAARRSRSHWERGALTIQNLQNPTWLPLDEIQAMRELTRLLSLRCRLELAEGKYDEAARSIQTGLALARHFNTGDLIIQDLVAVAFSAIMLSRVEEWVRQPGSPNLYWPLTDLPRPLIDTRKSIRHELNTFHRSFPALRELKKKKLTADEATKLLEVVFGCMGDVGARPAWMGKLATAALIRQEHGRSKKALLASGWKEKEVDALPAAQVVALAYVESYDRGSDEVRKWLAVPAWQGLEKLEKFAADDKARPAKDRNVFLTLLVPAITKTYGAQLRVERVVAGLRGAEALRQYRADKGTVPATWEDVTLPDPIDPYTGKGLGAYYSVKDGKATLQVPPPPGMPPLLGRRYEVGGKKN